MSRKSNLDAIFAMTPPSPLGAPNKASPVPPGASEPASAALGAPNAAPAPRIRSGVIAAMGGALETLAARAEVAEQVENGTMVVELDPERLEASLVSDRLGDPTDPGEAALVASIRQSGQQVPILVRPHPERAGRYQIAYGHRRARAARAIGRPVRALVRNLTDAELVVAQGKENLERRDLSYIERALFALRLEEAGFGRDTICAAMASDKADVSRYVALARALPEQVVQAIGPAPKAGRARWQTLSAQLAERGPGGLDALLADPAFRAKSSDARFLAVLAAIGPGSTAGPAEVPVTDGEGRLLGRVARGRGRFNLSLDEAAAPGLGDYILARLPEILAAHRAGGG